MGFDSRQNQQVPRISEADVKQPSRLAVWLNALADKLNGVKPPRFVVQRVSGYTLGTVAKVQNVGFNIGAVLLAGCWAQSQVATPLPDDVRPMLTQLQLEEGNASFVVVADYPLSSQVALTFSVVLFELDANSQQATTQGQLARLFSRRTT